MMTNSEVGNKKNTNLDNLYQILIQEAALLDNLVVLLENKQRSIVVGNVDHLKDYTAKEQLIARQAKAYSDTRQYLVQKILDDANAKDKIISLSNFIELSNLSGDKKWIGIRNKLDKAIAKIKKTNFENHELLQTSMAFVKEMVRVFLPKDKNSTGTYSKDGKVPGADNRKEVFNYQV